MRIAFVSANREQLPDPVVPLGILYIMSVAGDAHDKTLIDLCFEDGPLAALAASLDEFRPELVAVSRRNVQNAGYTDTRGIVSYYDDVLRTIRAHSAAPVVMGGGGFSVIPHELMARFGLDYGITGEGERAFAELIARLAAGSRDTGGIHNLLGATAPWSRRASTAATSSTSRATCCRTGARSNRATTSAPASPRCRPSAAARCSATTARSADRWPRHPPAGRRRLRRAGTRGPLWQQAPAQ